MAYLVSDTGVAILYDEELDVCLTFQRVTEVFYIDVFDNVTDAKAGQNTLATYQLQTRDVLAALKRMGVDW